MPSSPRADALWKDKGDGKTLRDRGLAGFHHYRKKWLEAISFQVQNNHAIARRDGTWRLIGWNMVGGLFRFKFRTIIQLRSETAPGG